MTHASLSDSALAVDPALLRLSVGLEDVDDLVADLETALRAPPTLRLASRLPDGASGTSTKLARPHGETSTSSVRRREGRTALGQVEREAKFPPVARTPPAVSGATIGHVERSRIR
jgi:hypothetical protein